MIEAPSPWPAPEVSPLDEPFWHGGAEGELRITRCSRCRFLIHPPSPACPACQGRRLRAEPVSGRGTVFSWTVNHQQWDRSGPAAEPYVIAIVELAEQPGLRVLSNIVDCAPEAIVAGMPVEVRFRRDGEIHLPVFVPVVGP